MAVESYRRYCLIKAYMAEEEHHGITNLGATWFGKHAEVAATDLPNDFVAREKLAAARYTAYEDVHGATVEELVHRAGLSRREAAEAIAEAAAWAEG